jgi:DNA-binding response OmpR family regulator
VLQAYEAIPEPAVLLVARSSEPGQLLGILLEGFGFRVLECRGASHVREALGRELPCVALVDPGLADVRDSLELIHAHGALPILLLVDREEPAPADTCAALGADAWERLEGKPTAILSALRDLLGRALEPAPALTP